MGSSLFVQVSLECLNTHAENLMIEIWLMLKRWRDRRWTRDCRKTRKLTQHEYEKINTGSELDMSGRYSNLMVVTYIVMFYGSGMPVMYPLALCYFFITFWVDKFLIFKCHRKPNITDDTMQNNSLNYYGFAVILHFIGGALMYSNAKILPTTSQYLQIATDKVEELEKSYTFGNVTSEIMIFYFVFFALIFVLYLSYFSVTEYFSELYKNYLAQKKIQTQGASEIEVEHNDFYGATSFSFLKKLYRRNHNYIQAIELARKNTGVVEPEIVRYENAVKAQMAAIGERFKEIANQFNQDIEFLNTLQVIEKLQELNLTSKLEHCAMAGTLHSYDILQNEDYQRLYQMRLILENKKYQTEDKKA